MRNQRYGTSLCSECCRLLTYNIRTYPAAAAIIMIVFNFISHILADKIGIKPVLIAASILNIIGFASMMTKTKMKLQMIKMKNLDFD